MMTMTFASLGYENQKMRTRSEKFLEEMDKEIPWAVLLNLMDGHCPKASKER